MIRAWREDSPGAVKGRVDDMVYENEHWMRRRRFAAALALLTTGAGIGVAQHDAGRTTLDAVQATAPTPSAVAAIVVSVAETREERKARLERETLAQAERLVRAEIRRGAFPGAALAAGRGAHLELLTGVGNAEWGKYEVDPERTIYDIASLTKVVATTTAVMLLVEDGRVDVDAPVSRYLPEFSGGARDRVTIRHLLTHTSGLPAGAGAPGTPSQALRALIRTPLQNAPGEKMVYSDVGFVVLYAAAERVAGQPVDRLLESRVFGPLGMISTGYNPGGEACDRCSPSYRNDDGTPVRGKVHDPTARKLGGVAGNAGLFSTAADLARFAAMLAEGGTLEGVHVFDEETIRMFTAKQPDAGNRALGWETPKQSGGSSGGQVSRKAFGHTGFTGTSMWIDPERGTWTVLLANRTFDPHASNRIQALRRAVNDRIAEAAELADVNGVLAD
ncbi:MAG TPA: serine hydrolase domain-containing protein [Longimicrobium sp.]|nr:serine hydrolase domain-containing protein [Longimicrobium sp.]